MAATSPSCLPTMSFWSPSSARAAKIPVSAEPGFVKRYSTPASFSVWSSSIPPVPVMVLRMLRPLSQIGSLRQSVPSAGPLYQERGTHQERRSASALTARRSLAEYPDTAREPASPETGDGGRGDDDDRLSARRVHPRHDGPCRDPARPGAAVRPARPPDPPPRDRPPGRARTLS